MSRPRSRDKSIPISVAMPNSMVLKLDNELDYTQSRSAWICNAIEGKLLGMAHNGIESKTTWQLCAALSMRPELDETLKTLLMNAVIDNQKKVIEEKNN